MTYLSSKIGAAFIGFLLVIALAPAWNPAFGKTIYLESDFNHFKLDNQLEYVEDADGSLELSGIMGNTDLPWRPSDKSGLSFGYTRSVYWIRFEIKNWSIADMHLLLEIANPLLDSVTAYELQGGKLKQKFELGADKVFSYRPVQHTHFLIPLEMVPGERQLIILRVASTASMSIPIHLWSAAAFQEKDQKESLLMGIVFGTLFIIGAYHFMLFLSLRENTFFTYAVFVFSILFGLASINGYLFHFLWPEQTAWTNKGILLGFGTGIFFSCFFTRGILLTKEHRPFLDKGLKYLAYASVFAAIVGLFTPYAFAIKLLMFLSVLTSGWIIISQVYRMADGYGAAKYTFFAGIFFTIGLLIGIMEKNGVISSSIISLNSASIGSVMMCIFNAFALSHRMNKDRDLRIQAEHESAETHKRLLLTQIELNVELDQRVRKRTLELEKANAQLQEISIRDALTQLYNRRYFDEIFAKEYKRAFRETKPISVLVLDLDHFKKVNDTYGHPFGDTCLIETGKWIRDSMKRPQDMAARYGGEEFVVLLPETSLPGAVNMAEQIIRTFNESSIEDQENKVTITVSIGVASCIPGDRDDHQELLKLADECLYRAKQNGRNRLESAMIGSTKDSPGTPYGDM
ncbi:MAG: GGDEF domain-containing protein [Deltaproteobacteria bacterium]|nr:GGDEF domain-containing protein [Deltaproteobacteria bacterium]